MERNPKEGQCSLKLKKCNPLSRLDRFKIWWIELYSRHNQQASWITTFPFLFRSLLKISTLGPIGGTWFHVVSNTYVANTRKWKQYTQGGRIQARNTGIQEARMVEWKLRVGRDTRGRIARHPNRRLFRKRSNSSAAGCWLK